MIGLSTRLFLLNDQDGIYLLPFTQFEQMRRTPQSHRIAQFADAQVRIAEVTVELRRRRPIRVIRRTFGKLRFDHNGSLDAAAHAKEMAELVRRALPLTGRAESLADKWIPSETLAERLDRAALGLDRCPRLRAES